jgi:NlpC/P60 family putative phage cell wall peptidase
MTRADETRAAILAAASGWLGTPYRHQGSTKGVGCDCLGLVRGVWREVYGAEPERAGPYAPDWAETGSEDRLLAAAARHCTPIEIDERRAGDLVVFRWRLRAMSKHLGILVARDRFLHAYEGHAVMASPLIAQWQRRISGVFVFPQIEDR